MKDQDRFAEASAAALEVIEVLTTNEEFPDELIELIQEKTLKMLSCVSLDSSANLNNAKFMITLLRYVYNKVVDNIKIDYFPIDSRNLMHPTTAMLIQRIVLLVCDHEETGNDNVREDFEKLRNYISTPKADHPFSEILQGYVPEFPGKPNCYFSNENSWGEVLFQEEEVE